MSAAALRIVLVGPDGSGKSTVAATLHELAREHRVPVIATHFRARLPTGGPPVTTPHGRSAHHPVVAVVRLIVRYFEFLRGFGTVWRRRKGKLVLIERGWWDQLVDPVRYRLPPRVLGLVQALGRSLPKMDVLILCDGDASVISHRKGELPPEEIAKQLDSWRRLARLAANDVVTIDTTRSSITDVADALFPLIQRSTQVSDRWRTVPFVPRRLRMRASGKGAVAARGVKVYQPLTSTGRVRRMCGFTAVLFGAGRGVEPPLQPWNEIVGRLGIGNEPAISIESNGQRAWILRSNLSIFKVASASDQDLLQEHATLTALPPRIGPVTIPRVLRHHDNVCGYRALELSLCEGNSIRGAEANQIAYITALALARLPTPYTHGDFTPWNLLRYGSEWCLIDWQRSIRRLVPAWDLLTWHVQSAVRLDGRTPAQIVREALDRSGWFTRYCTELGIPYGEAINAMELHLVTWLDVPDRSRDVAREVLYGLRLSIED